MLTVHHLALSQSERIVWLCEELGIPYDLVRYDREPSMAAPAAYKALHPLGTAPIITDDDFALAETGAIVEYVARRHGEGRLLLGPDHADFASYLFWFHFANGSMIPAFMMDMTAKRLGAATQSSRSDVAFDLVERRLSEARWFAGSMFSAADIMMIFPLTRARLFSGRDISHLPHLLAYLDRVGDRPAYKAALAKAEPSLTTA